MDECQAGSSQPIRVPEFATKNHPNLSLKTPVTSAHSYSYVHIYVDGKGMDMDMEGQELVHIHMTASI